MYDSRDRLPAIEAVFDRFLNLIKGAHECRSVEEKDFDGLWGKVCDGLEKYGNATAYFEWKKTKVDKNTAKRIELNGKAADVWANRKPVQLENGNSVHVFEHY